MGRVTNSLFQAREVRTRGIRPILTSWVCLGAIFFLVIVGGFYLARIYLETEVPFVVAEGISMQPVIREGDIIIFKGVEPDEIGVGDIIIFEVPDELEEILPPRITHRVIDKITTADDVIFRTKGDNAPLDSFEVPMGKVLGKKIVIIPYIGLIILVAKKPLGAVALVLAFVIISGLGHISREETPRA